MINISMIRAAYFRGQSTAVGARLQVTPLEAAAMIDAGKAELVKPVDQELVRAAVAAETARSCRAQAGPTSPRLQINAWPHSSSGY